MLIPFPIVLVSLLNSSSPFSTTPALLLRQLSYDFSYLAFENNLNTFVLELESQKYGEIILHTACKSSEQTCCLARHLCFHLIYEHKLTIHTLQFLLLSQLAVAEPPAQFCAGFGVYPFKI